MNNLVIDVKEHKSRRGLFSQVHSDLHMYVLPISTYMHISCIRTFQLHRHMYLLILTLSMYVCVYIPTSNYIHQCTYTVASICHHDIKNGSILGAPQLSVLLLCALLICQLVVMLISVCYFSFHIIHFNQLVIQYSRVPF